MAKFLCLEISQQGIQGAACDLSDLFVFNRKVLFILIVCPLVTGTKLLSYQVSAY